MSESFPLANPEPIGPRAKALSSHLNRINHAVDSYTPRGYTEQWQPCTLLGPPCTSRIVASLVSASSDRDSKDFLAYCAEACCTLEVKRKG